MRTARSRSKTATCLLHGHEHRYSLERCERILELQSRRIRGLDPGPEFRRRARSDSGSSPSGCGSELVRELLELADEIRAPRDDRPALHRGPVRPRALREASGARGAGRRARGDSGPERLELVSGDTGPGLRDAEVDVRLAIFRSDGAARPRAHRWTLGAAGRLRRRGGQSVGGGAARGVRRGRRGRARAASRGRLRHAPAAGLPAAPVHIHKLVFTGLLVDPDAAPRAGFEVSDARYWPLAALPELSLGRTLPLHLREALRVARDPNALPYFD